MKITPFGVVVVALSACIVTVLCLTFFHSGRTGGTVPNKAASALSGGFECTASVKWKGTEYVVSISRPESGSCTMTFSKPEELKNLSFVLEDSGLKVKYGPIEAAIDPSSLPQAALYNALLGALDAAAQTKEAAIKGTSGSTVISGSTSAGSFTLKLGPGYVPQSLSMPGQDLEVTFTKFSYTSGG